ncbi:MAG: hypothetical protein M1838_005797 [Thelocarpon superellum]|nr:MAG: hypothetical protein M1838_005797 [Thelocarpon superellum]
MCGRYALALRPWEIRRLLEESDMPVDEMPEDERTRDSYNVAPGYYEPVYRADVPDRGAGERSHGSGEQDEEHPPEDRGEASDGAKSTKYKLQSMKWGLVPFWTKRNPDYGSLMKTINCRDDSLLEDRGMWTSMKKKKRCIVVCQGFYEWLKKNGGKEKIPHFVQRKDRKLMCFAALWDCAQFEDSEEKLYTYAIITTSSNKQMEFLHDRMPVILENGSDNLRTWLDPGRSQWSKELQSMLKPSSVDLDIYPVSKEVGKVGNNSPTFIVPVSSAENKNNIANFFANAGDQSTKIEKSKDAAIKLESTQAKPGKLPDEDRATVDQSSTEDNAPLPVPVEGLKTGVKRERPDADDGLITASEQTMDKPTSPASKKMRSATSNHAAHRLLSTSPRKVDHGNRKITQFFGS